MIDEAGTFRLGDKTVRRMGYGAMQLAGPHVFGPPRDRAEAVRVLRAAVDAGVNHIDTSDFYGPHVVNEIIREALYPYPADLVIVTKIGAVRGDDASWNPAVSPEALRAAVADNLRNLKLDAMEVVNLRIMGAGLGTDETSIADRLAPVIAMKAEGLVRHIGLSNVSPRQVAEGRAMTDIACVQNLYNVAHRGDDTLIDELADAGIAYVPFFPLGGFTPLQSDALSAVAAELGRSPKQVALAWLLQRAPNVLLIPGTSRVAHLEENLAAAALTLPAEAVTRLDAIAGAAAAA